MVFIYNYGYNPYALQIKFILREHLGSRNCVVYCDVLLEQWFARFHARSPDLLIKLRHH